MKINKAVCLLVTTDKLDSNNKFSQLTEKQILDNGTGFFISEDGLIATADHVLKAEAGEEIHAVIDNSLYPIEIIKRFKRFGDGDYNDYAICKASILSPEFYDLAAFIKPYHNEELTLLGFTRKVKGKNSIEIKYKDGAIYYNEIKGRFFNHGITDGAGSFENGFIMLYNECLSDFPVGMSGGPVTNIHNNTAGVLFRGFNSTGCQCLYPDKLQPYI